MESKKKLVIKRELNSSFFLFIFTNKVIIFVLNNAITKAVQCNIVKKALLIFVIFSIFFGCKKDNPTSPENSGIETVIIGSKIWATKNLNVDHYSNGDPIPEVKDSATWANLKTGAWCYYNNDPALGAIYGKLYNFHAMIDPRGLAPEGFRVATYLDWMDFINLICYEKSTRQNWYACRIPDIIDPSKKYWIYDYVSIHNNPVQLSNPFGFSALPSGYRGFDSSKFYGMNKQAAWWAPYIDGDATYCKIIGIFDPFVIMALPYSNILGVSVRCIKN